jgi:Calcineurin-like phosphoesterase
MPSPDRILNLVRRTIDFTNATPGRTGKVVRLSSAATDVIVAGDMHGHLPNFEAVLKHANLSAHPGRHLVLQELIHGKFSYPTGGEKSHQLVDLFCALKSQFPDRVHYLPGNHELAQMSDRPIGKGNDNYNAEFRLGVSSAYGSKMGQEIYRAYMDLIAVLPLAILAPNRVLMTHSLPAPKDMPTFDPKRLLAEKVAEQDLVPGGSVYALVWGRDVGPENAADFLKKMDADYLITGHIPLEVGFLAPHSRHLIVDCSTTPAACVLVPADRPVTAEEIVKGVHVL